MDKFGQKWAFSDIFGWLIVRHTDNEAPTKADFLVKIHAKILPFKEKEKLYKFRFNNIFQ